MKIEYVDHYGSDLFVINAARRSFGVGYDSWSDTPRSPRGRSDPELMKDLAKDGHLLPFRHPHITLSCDSPIPIARQLGKHQVGFEWSETSRRYKTKGIEFYRIGRRWRAAPSDARQGSGDLLNQELQEELEDLETEAIRHSIYSYEKALKLGATPEQCRFLLLQSMEVSWTWTGSLLAWHHVYKQRTHKDTQLECREFAEEVGKIMSKLFPHAWSALIGNS